MGDEKKEHHEVSPGWRSALFYQPLSQGRLNKGKVGEPRGRVRTLGTSSSVHWLLFSTSIITCASSVDVEAAT
ncbi:hypothetical protein GOP47_0030114 [Adiantum capillus-veneris]|nr:hypothetical protein GOP47_0030114 [Adiantum capillus-veneris]